MTRSGTDMNRKIVVVGGGVAGLAAAHRLTEIAPRAQVSLLEASDRTGGLVGTEVTDGFVMEKGPDSILTEKPWAVAVARRLGIDGRLVGTCTGPRGAYVVHRGRLVPIPDGFALLAPTNTMALARTPVLSLWGKARAGFDLFLPRGPVRDDESLGSFVTRRFGREVLERLAQPLAGGIYGADPNVLSLSATMPRFLEIEREHRSVILGLRHRAKKMREGARQRAKASGARYGLFVSFDEGMQVLTDALAARLGDRIQLRAGLASLRREGEPARWKLRLEDGRELSADAVILALPAHRTAGFVGAFDATLGKQLAAIPYGSSATATFAFRREQVGHALDAFGFVVPTVERRSIIASTWASEKYPGRAPDGFCLLRAFVGGTARPEVAGMDDDAVREAALADLRELMRIEGEPTLSRVHRYAEAMPQYEVGHLGRVAEIEQRVLTHDGLRLAGNAYRGAGVPDSIHSGEVAAEGLVERFQLGTTDAAATEPAAQGSHPG